MSEVTCIDAKLASSMLPKRKEDGHKGTFGKLLIVGGAVGYTGAPYLAAEAAVHSGCGLVYLGVPTCIWQIEAVKCTSSMPFPLPDEGGMLCEASYGAVADKLSGCDVLALGPGLGRSRGAEKLVSLLLDFAAQSVVLDADGINALAGNPGLLKSRRGRVTVLTPHEAEFSRLSGLPLERIVRGEAARSPAASPPSTAACSFSKGTAPLSRCRTVRCLSTPAAAPRCPGAAAAMCLPD